MPGFLSVRQPQLALVRHWKRQTPLSWLLLLDLPARKVSQIWRIVGQLVSVTTWAGDLYVGSASANNTSEWVVIFQDPGAVQEETSEKQHCGLGMLRNTREAVLTQSVVFKEWTTPRPTSAMWTQRVTPGCCFYWKHAVAQWCALATLNSVRLQRTCLQHSSRTPSGSNGGQMLEQLFVNCVQCISLWTTYLRNSRLLLRFLQIWLLRSCCDQPQLRTNLAYSVPAMSFTSFLLVSIAQTRGLQLKRSKRLFTYLRDISKGQWSKPSRW